MAGLKECGYRAMPQVEQTLASSTWDQLSVPRCGIISEDSGTAHQATAHYIYKGYAAAGRAGACLHTMAVLQAYQADLLEYLDEREEIKAKDISELRRISPHLHRDSLCYWALHGSYGGSGKTFVADPLRHEKERLVLPH